MSLRRTGIARKSEMKRSKPMPRAKRELSPAQRCPTCVSAEGYDRLSGPCPDCQGTGAPPHTMTPDSDLIPSAAFLSHRWAETFARDRFPLVCTSCLTRSDSPIAEHQCDHLADEVRQRSRPGSTTPGGDQ